MAASATYEPLATFTNNGSTQAITFNSIPQGYTDLVFVCSIRSSVGAQNDSSLLQANNTQSIYSDTALSTDGATVTSTRGSNQYGTFIGNVIGNSAGSGIFATQEIYILNYTNTGMFKTVVSKAASDRNGAGNASIQVGLIRTTSAITRVDIFPSSANMISGSTVTMYGIKAA